MFDIQILAQFLRSNIVCMVSVLLTYPSTWLSNLFHRTKSNIFHSDAMHPICLSMRFEICFIVSMKRKFVYTFNNQTIDFDSWWLCCCCIVVYILLKHRSLYHYAWRFVYHTHFLVKRSKFMNFIKFIFQREPSLYY